MTPESMAEAALAQWGRCGTAPRLVKWRENIVFDVVLAGVGRVALRLHRPGYQSRSAVEAELDWTGRLAEAGQPVPAPVTTRAGGLTALADDRVASAVRWLPGAPVGAAERRLEGTGREKCELMQSVGRLIAGVHGATDALRLPADFDRPRWDTEGYLGAAPLWGRFWENPSFSADERALILEARTDARQRLRGAVDMDFGLIHGDVLRENVLSHDGRLSLIDFDDSGWGWRLYDLATALVQSLEEPGLPGLAAALFRGYREARGLSAEDEAVVPLFIMLRTFASAGWIATRAPRDDPRQRFYAARALRMAALVRAGRAPWQR